MDEQLTREEHAALEDLKDPKKAMAHISIRIRGDVINALRAEAKSISDERGYKVGYQNLIQEILTRHVQKKPLLDTEQIKKINEISKIIDIMFESRVQNKSDKTGT